MTRGRVWLVGEHNPYGIDPSFALYPLPEHASGGRLARCLGMSATEYLAAFARRNLLADAEWSAPAAREAAELLVRQEHPAGLVLLGVRVACAFGVPRAPYEVLGAVFVDGSVERTCLVPSTQIPHPSGRNRAWNDPATPDKIRRAVRALREEAHA
jgi:hypothetical protein